MVTNKNNYYVYVLLKTYKEGEFTYFDLKFNMEPFYVGKGREKRLLISKNERNSSNKHKSNIINKIISLDMDVSFILIEKDLSENESYLLEFETINKIGRKDLNKGPLCNLTAGGIGRRSSESTTKKKVSKYSIDGKYLESYDSIAIAESINKCSNISRCISGNCDTAGGFIWKLYTGNTENINTDHIKNKKQKGPVERTISQFNINSEFIDQYRSIKEAERFTGCSSSKIVLVCQGKRKQTNGFIFKYDK